MVGRLVGKGYLPVPEAGESARMAYPPASHHSDRTTRSLLSMSNRVGQAANKALRSVLGFAAARVASSDRLMSVVYDLMNETNFAGLSEHEEMLSDSVRVKAYHQGIRRNVQPGDVVVAAFAYQCIVVAFISFLISIVFDVITYITVEVIF